MQLKYDEKDLNFCYHINILSNYYSIDANEISKFFFTLTIYQTITPLMLKKFYNGIWLV